MLKKEINRYISWENIYLLGWNDDNGGGLTTWDGDQNLTNVVVLGLNDKAPPMWGSPAPPNATVELVPSDEDPDEYAKKLGGIRAFGWYYPDGYQVHVKG